LQLKKDFQARMKDSLMSATQEIERKAKEKRDAARLEEQRIKEKLKAAVEKGRQRDYISAPSKVDTTMGKNLALIKGIKNALAIKVECGMTEKQARAGLTDDQRIALEEYEFIEA
jgi:biotin synthase-like enzyme